MGESQRKQRSAANAVGGSTARACDGCLRRRARWYCGADDAFLCQACDASVHSANSLARRHQRLRLHTSSSSSSPSCLTSDSEAAHPLQVSWHRRKARTPRPKPAAAAALFPKTDPLVPDMENNHHNVEEEESDFQLIYQVPILAEFSPPLLEEDKPLLPLLPTEELSVYRMDAGYSGPSMEMDLPELDCFLRAGFDDDESSLYIDGFTLVDQEDAGRIKMELDIDAMGEEVELFRGAQGIDVGFDGYQAVKEQKEGDGGAARRMGLRLDYDAVINAWSQQGCSPWAGGGRPQFGPDGCLPSFMGMGEGRSGGGSWGGSGGGEEREARVTRYREKRRTRLFSKKIRYEVRKLNAEKRPRMKGRFVKRTTLSPVSRPTFPYHYNYFADP